MDEFFVKVNDEEKGPFTFEQLTDGRLEPNDLVRTGFTQWEKASDMPDFAEYFRYEGFYFPTEDNLAGFGIRLLAYLIDYILMVIILVAGIAGYLSVQMPGTDMNEFIVQNEQVLRTIIAPVFLITYFTVLAALPLSASLGQLMCKLIIVDADGKKISVPKALVRGVGKFLSGAFFGIGFIGVIFSQYKQAFHDVIARTYVIRKDVF